MAFYFVGETIDNTRGHYLASLSNPIVLAKLRGAKGVSGLH